MQPVGGTLVNPLVEWIRVNAGEHRGEVWTCWARCGQLKATQPLLLVPAAKWKRLVPYYIVWRLYSE